MRHPSKGAMIRPAERDRGCVFKDDFRSQANMVASGYTLFGTPTFDARGIGLNGTTQYGSIPIQREFSSASLTFHLEFYPDFEADDGASHDLMDTTPSLEYRVSKNVGNALLVFCGGTTIINSALATYQAYWITGGRNVISVSAVSGANTLWFNGTQIVTNALGWTPSAVTDLDVGRRSNNTYYFPGTISRIYIGHHTSDLAEHTAVYENTMWSYQNRAVVNLQFRTADYDIGNVRTLDSSGNGNHATLGDGSTPTTYPTQGAGRMTFDGGDYLDLGNVAQPAGAFTVAIAATSNNIGNQYYAGHHTSSTNFLLANFAGQWSFQSGGTAWVNGSHMVAAEPDRLDARSLVGVWDGTNTTLYVDGVAQAVAATPLAPSGGTSGMEIGKRVDVASSYAIGSVFDYVYTDGEAWNQTQILDYHSNVMRRMGAEV